MNKVFTIAFALLLLVSCKKEVIVFNGNPNTDFELPLILKLNGKDCFYDESTGLLKYSVDENALTDFSPLADFQEYSAIVFEGRKLKNHSINELGTVELHKRYAIDITTNGQTKHLKLEFTDMPLVRIVAFDKITNEPKTLAKMTVHYAGNNEQPAVDWVGVELRGASSLSFNKKSYGIRIYGDKSTDHAVSRSYFGRKANSKWNLDAMHVDKARCRNKASFALWASMPASEEYADIQSVFVEVYLNNRSVGLFCMNEHYTAEFLDLNAQSVFYKGLDNSEATCFNQLPGQAPSSARWGEWEQKFPDPSDQIVWNDFRALSGLIVDGSDTEFKQTICSLLDLENAMDYYLFVNLCGGQDNVGKNWHFLKRSPSDKFRILPWDLDGTWGRGATGNPQSPGGRITNRLFERLRELNPENYNQRLRQRWQQLRQDQFSEANLSALFEDNFDQLRHYRILEIENSLWNQALNADEEQVFIESWIGKRLKYLDVMFQ